MTLVVFLLVPEFHLLDLSGPAQVFDTAGDHTEPYRLAYVADREDVRSKQGLVVRADTTWPELHRTDLLVVPGWEAPERGGVGGWLSAAAVARIRAHHDNGGTVASVCAGSDALGRAGLLDGRRFTTHHELQDDFAARYPNATVVRDTLYVVDDRVITSAGIASGIDLTLHLMAVRHGPAVAARIARSMVVYARRNGDDQQTSVMMRHRAHLSDAVHRAQDRIDSRYTEKMLLSELAADCRVSERTLTRRFAEATGLTPLRYQQLLRIEHAEHLIGHGSTVEAAARAVGFDDARMLRRLRHRSTSG